MKMHFIGCCGVSMSVLMQIIRANGIQVTGSDISLNGGHNKDCVQGADVVVYTAAISQDNVEIVEAKRLGIPLIERAELLGQIARDYDRVIAIAGSHGKSTTTAMLGTVFFERNPTIHLGASTTGLGASRVGGKGYFITEACEYKKSFLKLEPTVGVVLNVELDHTDFYHSQKEYENAFSEFCCKCGVIVSHYDCQDRVGCKTKTITFGSDKADYYANNVQTVVESDTIVTRFEVLEYGELLGNFEIQLAGKHNIDNAIATIAVARIFGLDAQGIANALKKYTGIDRRWQVIEGGEYGLIVNDYAHHPTEIKASIDTARQVIKLNNNDINHNGKIRVLFQPHTYTRTLSLVNDFVSVLSCADTVALVPIYAAREKPINGVTHHTIGKLIKDCICYDNLSNAREFLKQGEKKDITIIMGAGDIDTLIK